MSRGVTLGFSFFGFFASRFPSCSRQVDHETLKRHDYDDQGIVVARIDDQRLSEWERQFLKNVGNKLYGQR